MMQRETEKVLSDIATERARQDEKWGEQNHDPFKWFTTLMEEVGEAAKESLDIRANDAEDEVLSYSLLREELVQVAAVAAAFVECLDRDKWDWPEVR